ncbi:MAG: T9SS type A sorting domain-containing protein, partial [Flavobacteriales bacterium]
WDSTYEVYGHDSIYEPHHDVITRSDQVQIYEFVMGDVNGDVTTTLLRAAYRLKDNRIPPIGFTTSHASYDTTRIAGLALMDPNFNHDALGTEGNGGDMIHYHIATNGYMGAVEVKTKVYFQQVPPRWNREMFSHNAPRIDAFRAMYAAADGTPDLVVADSMVVLGTGVRDLQRSELQAFPNPTRDGFIMVPAPEATKVLAYDAAGKRVPLKTTRSGDGWRCELPEQPGVYHLVISKPQGNRMVRVVRTAP